MSSENKPTGEVPIFGGGKREIVYDDKPSEFQEDMMAETSEWKYGTALQDSESDDDDEFIIGAQVNIQPKEPKPEHNPFQEQLENTVEPAAPEIKKKEPGKNLSLKQRAALAEINMRK